MDQRITLIEVGNGEGAIGSSGYFPSYEYYTRALDKGWHVAPTNNQDNHKGNWGDSNTARSVVLADALTEDAIYDAIASYLGLTGKKKTSADGLFTLETVACLGACGLAPVMTIDGEVHAQMTPEAALSLLEDIRKKEEAGA